MSGVTEISGAFEVSGDCTDVSGTVISGSSLTICSTASL